MVHITQCLCPDCHNVSAIVWEEPAFTTPDMAIVYLKSIIDLFLDLGLKSISCSICHSRDFHYEDSVTRFASLQDTLGISADHPFQMVTRKMVDKIAYRGN